MSRITSCVLMVAGKMNGQHARISLSSPSSLSNVKCVKPIQRLPMCGAYFCPRGVSWMSISTTVSTSYHCGVLVFDISVYVRRYRDIVLFFDFLHKLLQPKFLLDESIDHCRIRLSLRFFHDKPHNCCFCFFLAHSHIF